MIPHPLTLLYCGLLGFGLSRALDLVLQFAGELCADAVRFGLTGERGYGLALMVLGGVSTFSGALFIGAAMRLLAEKSPLRAAGWAAPVAALAGLIAGSLAWRSPLDLLLTALGAFAGAYVCDRFCGRGELEGAETLLRSWMFWERGGAQ